MVLSSIYLFQVCLLFRGELYEDDNMVVDGTTTNIEVQMEDNDLTNLTWLQDRNLLRSMCLHFLNINLANIKTCFNFRYKLIKR